MPTKSKSYALFGGATASLMIRQRGLCPACGTFLLHADHGPQSPSEWEQWTRTLTKAIRKAALVVDDAAGDDPTTRLMHTHCRQREQHQRQREIQHEQNKTSTRLA